MTLNCNNAGNNPDLWKGSKRWWQDVGADVTQAPNGKTLKEIFCFPYKREIDAYHGGNKTAWMKELERWQPNYSESGIKNEDDPAYAPFSHKEVSSYFPSPDLIRALCVAEVLNRPLLLMGEPGCGKTCLAKYIAWATCRPYFEWQIKSSTQAGDGLYDFDSPGLIQDITVLSLLSHKNNLEDSKKRAIDALVENNRLITSSNRQQILEKYFNCKNLAMAFSTPKSILLIDEIDKAGYDFPNDLLHELDNPGRSIPVPEINDSLGGLPINPEDRPLVIITSNKTKALPGPFLRRCLFHEIPFPDADMLLSIMEKRISENGVDMEILDQSGKKDEFFVAVRDAFNKIRSVVKKNMDSDSKTISTSELIDWTSCIIYRMSCGALGGVETVISQLNDISNNEPVICPEAILKTQEQRKSFRL